MRTAVPRVPSDDPALFSPSNALLEVFFEYSFDFGLPYFAGGVPAQVLLRPCMGTEEPVRQLLHAL